MRANVASVSYWYAGPAREGSPSRLVQKTRNVQGGCCVLCISAESDGEVNQDPGRPFVFRIPDATVGRRSTVD